ncbi:TlpA disulfide reductase family protein [Umezawaea sp. Da 62-37]|uniref:TlpA family protein disulfide reductase n=1 Tax=Umezawaea sp. Da 62-37 TaxID=3075927 RepID=UPI0028F6F8CD|nr:TlpA disulfide reductase family protein [Umezawaea sp. Da 62-37]WNV91702.1 TlpA disulfide reductase family protein [Umezawaea sp. Da 62-37]
MRVATRWALVALVLVVAGVVAIWPRSDDRPPQRVGDSRPGKDLGASRDLAALRPCPRASTPGPQPLRGILATCLGDGASTDAATTVGGGPALINFWATWCQPCQEELKVLDGYSQQPGAVPVVAVQVQSGESDGLELLARLGVHLPSLHDEPDALRRVLKAPQTLPASFVVKADGSVIQVTSPLVFSSPEQVREAVA